MFKGRSFLVKMVKDDEAGHEEEVDVTEDIRSHFQKNKNAYIAGISGFAFASITCLIMRERHAGIQSVSDGPAKVTMRPLTFFSSRTNSIVDASETIVNVIEREGRGHPGYLTECIENGKKFLTQSDAAMYEGVSDMIMSNHILGKLPDINGHHYRRLANLSAIA